MVYETTINLLKRAVSLHLVEESSSSSKLACRIERGRLHLAGNIDVETVDYQVMLAPGAPEPWTGRLRWTLNLDPVNPDQTPPFFVIPGIMLGENRPSDDPGLYPRYDPLATTPAKMSASGWDFSVDRIAYPAALAKSAGGWLALAAEPHVRVSGPVYWPEEETQVGFGIRGDAHEAYLRVSLPATNEPYTHAGSVRIGPSRPTMTIAPGGSVQGRLFLWSDDTSPDAHFRFLRGLYHYFAERNDSPPMPDAKTILAAGRDGLVRWTWRPEHSCLVYSVSFDRIAEQIAAAHGKSLEQLQMHVAWVSGLPTIFPLLWWANRNGDREARDVAVRVTDLFSGPGLSPCGLFWGRYAPQVKGRMLDGYFGAGRYNGFDGGWNPEPHWLHLRTIGEGVWFLAKLIGEERAAGFEHPAWVRALESNVAVALKLQREDGNFGGYVDALTGQMLNWKGTGALSWIPALFAAGTILKRDFTAFAVRAGEYYAPFVLQDRLYGAPEDCGVTVPTSEDGYNAIMAYAALYRATEDTRWRDLCRHAAEWTFLWRKAFNTAVPRNSLVGVYGLKNFGLDYASSKNNHGHVYGLIATQDLLDLSDWTGDPYYAQRAEDHWRASAQLMALADGQFNSWRGLTSEQFYFTNWICFGNDLSLVEPDGRPFTGYDPGPHFSNKGHVASFAAAWCTGHLMNAAICLLEKEVRP